MANGAQAQQLPPLLSPGPKLSMPDVAQTPLINFLYQANYLDLNFSGFRDAKLRFTGEMKTMAPLTGGDFSTDVPHTITTRKAKPH